MARELVDYCASCGRPRGDGRRDRGWKYFWADVRSSKLPYPLALRACVCAACFDEMELTALRLRAEAE